MMKLIIKYIGLLMFSGFIVYFFIGFQSGLFHHEVTHETAFVRAKKVNDIKPQINSHLLINLFTH